MKNANEISSIFNGNFKLGNVREIMCLKQRHCKNEIKFSRGLYCCCRI